MAIERPWKSLEIVGDLPSLWLKARLDGDGAVFQLTDLNKLWGINLSRARIIRSAADQRCSIDPGEDDDQYAQFLAKINSALSNEEKTNVAVEAGGEPDSVRFSVSAPLPGSLPTFKWTVELHLFSDAESTTLATDLTNPLLAYVSTLKMQVHQLVEELGHKDRVISKITDKLETSGNDLTQVFPIVSNMRISKKSSQRSQLAKYVDGLADFDEAAWKAQNAQNIDGEGLCVEEIDSIFAELPQPRLSDPHSGQRGAWYLPRGQLAINEDADTDLETPPRNNKLNRRQLAAEHEPSLPRDESTQVDEFQRQNTPPRTKQQPQSSPPVREHRAGMGTDLNAPNEATSANDDDEATTDDDDLDGPSQRPLPVRRSSQKQSASSQPLSQSDKSPQTNQASTNHTPKRKTKLGGFGGKSRAALSPEPEASGSPAAKPRSKLGAFGGNSKKDPSPVAEPEVVDEVAPVSPKPFRRLGRFGGKAAEGDAPSLDADPAPEADKQPRHAVTGEEAVPERENSEERANKKREKLKRELEEKSKAPVKKKRKF